MQHVTIRSVIPTLLGLPLLVAAQIFAPAVARAQATNAEILQEMAVQCVRPLATPYARLSLRPDPANPFLNQAVFNALTEDDKLLYLDSKDRTIDSVAAANEVDASLGFNVERVSIRYARDGRRKVTRNIDLDLSYILVGPDRRILSNQTCSTSHADQIHRSQMDEVENQTIPLTQGVRPSRGWLRRYAEPVVIGAASAVAVYLFFNIRSDSNESP